jgi:hypothetical protein
LHLMTLPTSSHNSIFFYLLHPMLHPFWHLCVRLMNYYIIITQCSSLVSSTQCSTFFWLYKFLERFFPCGFACSTEKLMPRWATKWTQ